MIIYYSTMRKIFIGGNWKCNNTLPQTQQMITNIIDPLEFNQDKVGTASIIQMLLWLQYSCTWSLFSLQKNSLMCKYRLRTVQLTLLELIQDKLLQSSLKTSVSLGQLLVILREELISKKQTKP